METVWLFLLLGGQALTLAAVAALWFRRPPAPDLSAWMTALDRLAAQQREEAARNRGELGQTLKNFNDSQLLGVKLQTESVQQELSRMRQALGEKLRELRQENTAKLEEMRATVNEKLQQTLDQRLRDSFKLVSERLEQVYQGLGEMRNLASGVGDLKRVLTNVKTRGTWGEVQLGALLEQVLTPAQYVTNFSPKGNQDRVEFAIRLPGQREDSEPLYLPIDAKFPAEDYQRLLDARDAADAAAAEQSARLLEQNLKAMARSVRDKYVNPPVTTDFALLFLPTEGLFAEVVRRPGLADYLQTELRIVVAGPTTLWSILNSLQLGFRTLAIERRSGEVWKLLEAVKAEWLKYAEALDNVNDRLRKASESIEKTQVRVRAIGRKLREVQELPDAEANRLLELES